MSIKIQHGMCRIENTYAWDGSKRRRVVLDDNNNTLSDECYYGDLVVENGQPLRILHAEGYVDVSGMPVFNYHLKDHLGNVRAVISSSYGPGAYTQTQSSDYYPFGMAHTVEISSVKNGKAMEAVRVDPRETDESKTFTRSNAYLYNGKEEQPMPGKWLDYGARFYDAQLGRWHSVDPMADQRSWVSSFSYCQNDPINRIDPDGMYDDWVEDPNHPEKGTYFDPNIKSIGEAEDAGLIWHGHTTLLLDKDGNTKYGDQYGKTWDMAPLMEVVVLAKMTDHQRIMSNPYVQAIHQGQEDFLNHPVTQTTVNTLLFVATGGIEGAVSLASGAKSVFNLAKNSQPSDWIRTGKTVVSNQIVKGQGTPGAIVTWGVKGGGNIAKTGESMGFHYHIHKYNWYNPASWFKQTPIIKPRKL